MSTKRHAQELAQEIAEDLQRNDLPTVHVEVDEKDIAYLTGAVADRDAEADAVAVALKHAVTQVQDGIEQPGHVPPHMAGTGALGPLSPEHAPAADPVHALLGSAHLEGRIFHTSAGGSSLETGTPLASTSRE